MQQTDRLNPLIDKKHTSLSKNFSSFKLIHIFLVTITNYITNV